MRGGRWRRCSGSWGSRISWGEITLTALVDPLTDLCYLVRDHFYYRASNNGRLKTTQVRGALTLKTTDHEQLTNPARVLHDHLRAIRQSASDKELARDVVARRFFLPADNEVRIRRVLAQLDDLFVDVTKMVESMTSADHAIFVRHFPMLRAGLARVTLATPSSTAFNFISDAALENLDLCASRISEDYREVQIASEELAELDDQIKDTFTYIKEGEFEPEFKEIALDLLGTLRKSLIDYQIRGIQGMKRAVEESIGKLLRIVSTQPDVPHKPLERLKTIIMNTEAVVARALTYGPYLVESVRLLLPPSAS